MLQIVVQIVVQWLFILQLRAFCLLQYQLETMTLEIKAGVDQILFGGLSEFFWEGYRVLFVIMFLL
jgi:hypothetical protein